MSTVFVVTANQGAWDDYMSWVDSIWDDLELAKAYVTKSNSDAQASRRQWQKANPGKRDYGFDGVTLEEPEEFTINTPRGDDE